MAYDGRGSSSWRVFLVNELKENELNQETLMDLDDVELLHRVDEIVSRFDELDPGEAGDALGALVREFGERHSPEALLAQFRRLILEHDPDADVECELGVVRDGMARREVLRRAASPGLTRNGFQGGCALLGE